MHTIVSCRPVKYFMPIILVGMSKMKTEDAFEDEKRSPCNHRGSTYMITCFSSFEPKFTPKASIVLKPSVETLAHGIMCIKISLECIKFCDRTFFN